MVTRPLFPSDWGVWRARLERDVALYYIATNYILSWCCTHQFMTSHIYYRLYGHNSAQVLPDDPLAVSREECSIGYFTNYTLYLIRQMSNIILKYVNYTIFDMYNLIKSTFCQYILSNLMFYFIH